MQIRKTVTVQVSLTATGAATGAITVAMPFAPRAGYLANQSVGSAAALIGTTVYTPATVEINGSTIVFRHSGTQALRHSGTQALRHSGTGLWGSSAARQATFAAGSTLSFTATYEAA